jgi:hypothetical protein
MPKPKNILYTFATPSATFFASNVTGATWSLTNTTTGDNVGHLVIIKNNSATNHSGKTALLTGTDENNDTQTETITLPTGSATVTSTKYFTTLTSVVPSATIGANTMDIGIQTAGGAMSHWFPLNYRDRIGKPSFVCTVTGTINYTIQQTQNNIFNPILPTTFADIDDTTFVSAATSQNGAYETTPTAMRIKINSYSTGATLKFDLIDSASE